MVIRKAEKEDIQKVASLYDEIHTAEENGITTHKWKRGIYPTETTAENAFASGELFVLEENGEVLGSALINQKQVDCYDKGEWKHQANDDEVMVIHTLVISPKASGRGYGRAFIAFYENYAREHGCRELRMDTNELNTVARKLYKKLGYEEIGMTPTTFNGVPGVSLVFLEKYLPD